jgi:hypothetical protein
VQTAEAPVSVRAHVLEGRPGAVTTWLVIWLWTAAWAWNRWPLSGLSWHFLPTGAQALFGDSGLHLYAQHPELQIGPLAFVVTELGAPLGPAGQKVAAQLLMTAAAPLLLWLLAPLLDSDPARRRLRLVVAAVVLAPSWTDLSVRWMHLEDVIALVLAVLAVRLVGLALRDEGIGRTVPLAGLALAGAMLTKPWAVGFVPILLALPLRRMLTGAAVAAGATVAGWGPFLLVPGALAAFSPPVGVASSSGLWVLGYRGDVIPAWGRLAQLVGAPLVGALAALRGRWPGVLLAAIAVRLALDPQDLAYYAAGAVVAALVLDLLTTRWVVPWTALLTAVVLWQPFATHYAQRLLTEHGLSLWWFQHPGIVGVVHVAWAVAMVLRVVAPAPGRSRWTVAGEPGAVSVS